MKRGAPLQRKTPLVNKAPLKTHKPLERGCHPLQRRTPLAPVSARRRADNAHRTIVVSAMRLATAGQCARCGRRDMPVHGHERLGRAQGGEILRPDCLLCDLCNAWAEDFPKLAAWTGWKISGKHPHDHTLRSDQAWALDGSIVEFTVAEEEVA